ncbi:MAG: hypothetical protein ACRCUS_05085 [Anaerovoracaceae bacterium]
MISDTPLYLHLRAYAISYYFTKPLLLLAKTYSYLCPMACSKLSAATYYYPPLASYISLRCKHYQQFREVTELHLRGLNISDQEMLLSILERNYYAPNRPN